MNIVQYIKQHKVGDLVTIGDVIKQYRQKSNLSMDDFAKRCLLSKGYISMLESNVNPRNGKPIAPTLESLSKVALGMNIEVDQLLKLIDVKQTISPSDKINNTNKNFKDIIVDLRNEKNLNQIQLADKLDVSPITVAMWETGKRQPSTNMYKKLSSFFDIDIDFLYGRTKCEKNIFNDDTNIYHSANDKHTEMILHYFNSLNELGKNEAIKRIEELTYIPKYLEDSTCPLNSSHENDSDDD